MGPALGNIFFQDSVFGWNFYEILVLRKEGISHLAGRYNNPTPTLIIAPVDCFKIPALLWYNNKN